MTNMYSQKDGMTVMPGVGQRCCWAEDSDFTECDTVSTGETVWRHHDP